MKFLKSFFSVYLILILGDALKINGIILILILAIYFGTKCFSAKNHSRHSKKARKMVPEKAEALPEPADLAAILLKNIEKRLDEAVLEAEEELQHPFYLRNIEQHRLYLNVPFEEKEMAKPHHARWDESTKKWYSINRHKYPFLKRWAPNDFVVYDALYVLKAPHRCWVCGQVTNVIAFAAEHYCDLYENPVQANKDKLIVASEIAPLPIWLSEGLYATGYYSDRNTGGFCNHCTHCRCIQGNYYLHDELDGPFFSAMDNPDIIWHRILLREDISVDITFSCDSDERRVPAEKIQTTFVQQRTWEGNRPLT